MGQGEEKRGEFRRRRKRGKGAASEGGTPILSGWTPRSFRGGKAAKRRPAVLSAVAEGAAEGDCRQPSEARAGRNEAAEGRRRATSSRNGDDVSRHRARRVQEASPDETAKRPSVRMLFSV